MADVITRLKLESGEYDSKIKRATQGLLQMETECRKVGGTLAILEKEQKQYVQSLGNMQTVSNTVRGKIGELSGAFVELRSQYNRLTDEEKKGDFGKALSASLDQLKIRINEAKKELNGITTELNGKAGGGFGGMMGKMSGMLGVSPVMLTGIGAATAAFAGLKTVIGDNISTAKGFEKSMSQLSSLTGMTGKDLEKLKGYAIELGSSTTLSASQVADAFKMIGSQQPQLLSSGEALKGVTKNAITLAEAAGIELSDAAKTLSVSINQMGGDSNNAERYINVLAAAAQKGAGDIVWLGEAITKSGTTAKAVGTDYEELVANLEQLAKAGYDASTAGTALRSIIMNLEKQANQQYKPSVVGLTEAFKNLGEANLTLTEYQGIAGKMFAAQAKALADAAAEAKNMKEEITGTNIAEEQAKTNTDNLDGSLKSLASAWEGLNLHINDSNGFLRTCVDWLKDVVVWADQAFTAAGRAQKKLLEMQGGTGGISSPTKVDKQINALGGSNFKQQKFNSQMNKYNQDIKVAEYYIKKYQQERDKGLLGGGGLVLSDASRRFGGVMLTGEEDLQNMRESLIKMRDEYQSRGQKLIESVMGSGKDNGKGGTTVTFDVDADTEEATKSIKDLQEEIKKLKKLRDDAANAGNTKLRDQYNMQIKSVQAQIKSMRGGSGKTEKTEIQKNEEKIKKLSLEYAKLGDVETEASRKRQEEIKKEIELLQQRNGLLGLRAEQAKGRLLPNAGDFDRDTKNVGGIGMLDQATNFGRDIAIPSGGLQLDDKAMNAVQKNIHKQMKDVGKIGDEWSGVASAIGAVGNAMAGIEDPAAKVLGIVAQAIATVALTFSKSLAGTVTPWDWIAAAAAGTATMISTISAIHSATGYAEGGMIKGNSYSGDNLMATGPNGALIGLNAGELVLNKAQQGNLASQLQGGGMQNLNLTATIKGEQIRLALNNNGRRTGRGEYVQSRNVR